MYIVHSTVTVMVELKSSRFSDDDNYNDKTLFLLIEIDNEIEVAANRS